MKSHWDESMNVFETIETEHYTFHSIEHNYYFFSNTHIYKVIFRHKEKQKREIQLTLSDREKGHFLEISTKHKYVYTKKEAEKLTEIIKHAIQQDPKWRLSYAVGSKNWEQNIKCIDETVMNIKLGVQASIVFIFLIVIIYFMAMQFGFIVVGILLVISFLIHYSYVGN